MKQDTLFENMVLTGGTGTKCENSNEKVFMTNEISLIRDTLNINKNKQGRSSKPQYEPVKPSKVQWLAWLNEQN